MEKFELFTLARVLLVQLIVINLLGCDTKMKTSELPVQEFEHAGLSRAYIYYAPQDLEKGAPLLVVLHGYTSSASNIMDYSGFNKIADKHNFAVVYPQGTVDKDSNTFWNVGYSFHDGVQVDDVDFITSLVRHLQEKYSLSVSNTFITGMSNGGEMCYLMLCLHPKVFKAAAPVAGMMLQSFFDDCNFIRETPVFSVFGTADKVTNFNGDLLNEDGWGSYISIPSTIEFWADRIDYDTVLKDTLPDLVKSDSSYVVSERYLNDQNFNEVMFYKVVNGGHDWPGSSGNMDVSTSLSIWSFFENYVE